VTTHPPGRSLRVALFGSPGFALPSLEALHGRHDLALVVAQPDKRAGRGLKTVSPATVVRARELGIETYQPARLKPAEVAARIRSFDLDVAVTAAYGKILPAPLLEIPRFGFLNVHASLLPRYRGAAPIQWALIRSERETGITIMQTEAGLDTGAIRHVQTVSIGADDDATTLFGALAHLGAETLMAALDLLVAGQLPSTPQSDEEATFAPMLTREDGRIRWREPAQAIVDRHRGVAAWPGSWFELAGDSVKVHALAATAGSGEPGHVLAFDAAGVTVASGEGAVRLLEVQPSGRARMAARAWANGRRLKVGDRLG
jgi:methionyl-tRNA formyltransferase